MTLWRYPRNAVRAVAAVSAMLVTVLVAPPPARADFVRDAQWHLDYLKVTQAHRISQGTGVTVAVVDTGVDADHPDLAGAVLPGADLALVPAGKSDGRTDTDGHGTGMAGLVAARGRGGSAGALGIAPKAKILPIRYTDSVAGASSRVPEAIRWAAEHGAKVISMSFGVPEGPDLQEAVVAAQRADVVLVAAVGNRPTVEAVEYPAAYPGVIAAAGVDRRGNHAAVSVTGPQVVLAAPAVDIVTTDKRGQTGYRKATGTSDATAIIAGAAALVRAKFPKLSAAEVVHRLTATARDKGPAGRDAQYGFGVLDLVAALTATVPPLQAAPTTAAPSSPGGVPPGGAIDTPTARHEGLPVGVMLVGLGCLLLVTGAAAAIVWHLVRRRRPGFGVNT